MINNTNPKVVLDGQEQCFEGICKGEITQQRTGSGGFGYDPVFKPEGYQLTFAQMPLAEKNKIGHRGKATQLLLNFLKK